MGGPVAWGLCVGQLLAVKNELVTKNDEGSWTLGP
jgi:hypothetical protein